MSGVFKVVIAACALSLIAAHLSPATAAPVAQVVTCVDLVSGKERISKTGTCRTTEATAKWHLASTDSALASGSRTKSLTICSNKESSPVTYQRIRSSCSKHMQTSLYTRSAALPSKPVITQVFSNSYESVSLALARDPAANLDAPIAYYTITSSKGDVKKVNSWRELTVTVSGLTSSTSYTFTITATNADGTSLVSAPSLPVTTQTYVAPVEEPKNLYADGSTWTLRTAATDNSWYSVTYGNGTFVAVATSGTGNRVMTSPDGITWTSRTSAADSSWRSITYGNGTFVAVAWGSVMTSPDGITWTSRTSAVNNNWRGVTYGNGTFVAVATTGNGNRVMTSPDGITWTSRSSAADYNWNSVTYGNGIFVAVGQSSTYFNAVMTSPDGITWTSRTAAGDWWLSVTYANGIFVAVGQNSIQATDNRVMTSPDGITWTLRTAATNNSWFGVTYGNGTFVAVAAQGFVMTSTP